MKSEPFSRRPNIEKCVAALSATLAGMESVAPDSRKDVTATVAFILATQEKMPDYLRLAIRALTMVFDAWPLVVARRPFHGLCFEQRKAQIEHWERSRLAFRRALIEFYRSFVAFGLHSDPNDQEAERVAHAKLD